MTAGPRAPRLDPGAPARELLTAVERQYAEAGVELPERRYLLAGNAAGAAWDDEHLSVSMNAVQPTHSAETARQNAPSGQIGQLMMPRGVYEIRILRSWPVLDDSGGAPTAEEITAASETLFADSGLITMALFALAARDRTNRDMRIGEVQPLGPLGELCGYSCVVTISPLQEGIGG